MSRFTNVPEKLSVGTQPVTGTDRIRGQECILCSLNPLDISYHLLHVKNPVFSTRGNPFKEEQRLNVKEVNNSSYVIYSMYTINIVNIFIYSKYIDDV